MARFSFTLNCKCGWQKTISYYSSILDEKIAHTDVCKYYNSENNSSNKKIEPDKALEREMRIKIAEEVKQFFYPLCVCDECTESKKIAHLIDRIVLRIKKEARP